ncbi:MAG TPA: fimbria/pilus periplasmic chaperone [Burkholderiales bacterium]
MRAFTKAALALALCTLAQAAAAGVFSVTPVRIYMTPKDRAVAVTINNESESPIALQADVYVWKQTSEGADELVLSEDLILAPPIIKLGPKARQVVRLARLQPPDASRQLTYRLILRELPEANPSKGIDVPIALALSMPVFITPPGARHETNCSARRSDSQSVALTCANGGTAYAQVREIAVRQGDEVVARFETGTYLLPGAQRVLPVKSERPLPSGPLRVTVTFDDASARTFELDGR